MITEEIIEELTKQFEAITDGGNVTKASEALRYAISVLKQEPCNNAIDKEAALDLVQYYDDYDSELYKAIKRLPPVRPMHGKMLVCPSCGLDVHSDFHNCPRCGAKMEDDTISDDAYLGYCPNCGSECMSGSQDTECWKCGFKFTIPHTVKEKEHPSDT